MLVALTLTLLGLAMRFGVGVPDDRVEGATIAFSAAGALSAVALLPFPYALRAVVALVVGLTLMALGMKSGGPLGGLTVDGNVARGVARLVTLTTLPAALFFRARYTAFGRARGVLAGALVLSLPFVGMEVALVADGAAPWVPRLGAGLSIAFVLCSLFGFTGQGTTGWGALWAALVLGGIPLEVALRHFVLADATTGYLTYPATAVGLVCAATVASLGLFQLLATFWAPEARRLSLVGARVEGVPKSGTA
ncbi:MAG: hypothetical protein U0263_35795 [Polyangiaceae bacterium]